jgi:hypothetical protein
MPTGVYEHKHKQKAGEFYSFPCGHSGVLPKRKGAHNKLAIWRTSRWNCRTCDNLRHQGLGKSGLISGVKNRLSKLRNKALERNHSKPNIGSEDALKAWLAQKEKCAWTGESLTFTDAVLEHDHNPPGVFRGWVQPQANRIEGNMNKLSYQGRVNMIKTIAKILFPNEFADALLDLK